MLYIHLKYSNISRIHFFTIIFDIYNMGNALFMISKFLNSFEFATPNPGLWVKVCYDYVIVLSLPGVGFVEYICTA